MRYVSNFFCKEFTSHFYLPLNCTELFSYELTHNRDVSNNMVSSNTKGRYCLFGTLMLTGLGLVEKNPESVPACVVSKSDQAIAYCLFSSFCFQTNLLRVVDFLFLSNG